MGKSNPGIKVSRVGERQVRFEVGRKWAVVEVGKNRDSMRIVAKGTATPWTERDRIGFIAMQAAEWLASNYNDDFNWGPYTPKVTRRNPPRDDGYLSPEELAEKSAALRMARELYADLGFIYKSKGKWHASPFRPKGRNSTVEQVAPVRRNPPRRERIEVYAERHSPSGDWLLSAIVGGQRFKQRYNGYTKRDAIADFKASIADEMAQGHDDSPSLGAPWWEQR